MTGKELIDFIKSNNAEDLPVYRMGEPFCGEEYKVEKVYVCNTEYGEIKAIFID